MKTRVRGFTLIELLVVVAIIGMLTSLLVVNYQGARERARDAQRKSDLRALKTALRLYYNDFQSYPNSNQGMIMGCGVNKANPTGCNWGDQWSLAGTLYMGKLPADPLNQGDYIYSYTMVNSDNFQAVTSLENLSDPGIKQSQTECAYTPPAGKEATYIVCAD